MGSERRDGSAGGGDPVGAAAPPRAAQLRRAQASDRPENTRASAPDSPKDASRPSARERTAPISIERMTVGSGRLVCEVRLASDAPRLTTPALIRRVRTDFPALPHHTCVNESGPTFASVMDRTPLPHLLEHLVIDLQTRAATCDDAAFVGTTDWIDEAAGTARVQVSFTDDLVALRAFRDAAAYLNECVLP